MTTTNGLNTRRGHQKESSQNIVGMGSNGHQTPFRSNRNQRLKGIQRKKVIEKMNGYIRSNEFEVLESDRSKNLKHTTVLNSHFVKRKDSDADTCIQQVAKLYLPHILQFENPIKFRSNMPSVVK